MCCYLRVKQTPDAETLLKTRQMMEVRQRWTPSTAAQAGNTHMHRRTILHLPVSLHTYWLLSSCNNLSVPPIPSSHCFCLLCSVLNFLSFFIVHVFPSHLRVFFIPLLCFADPLPTPPHISLLPSLPYSHTLNPTFKPSNLLLFLRLLFVLFFFPRGLFYYSPSVFISLSLSLAVPLFWCCCKGQVSSMNKL